MKQIQNVDKLIHVETMSYSTILKCPQNVVYCFLNDDLKRFQCFFGASLWSSLGRLEIEFKESPEYEAMREDSRNLSLVILETCKDKKDLKMRHAYWVEHFVSRNYTPYKKLNPVEMVLETRIESWNQNRIVFNLYAVGGGREVLLGEFFRRHELDSFVQENYPEGKIFKLKYKA